MKSPILNFARAAKARSISFRKHHRPIAIFGLRRGGTTILADMISENRGVWLANEPFAVLPRHRAYETKRKLLPIKEHSHYFNLKDSEEERFHHYATLLLNASLPQIGTCRRTKFLLTADRVCMKILNAPWMIKWFAEYTDCHILPILRHPGAQASSVLRQNWDFPLEAYWNALNSETDVLNRQELNKIQEALQSGDRWRIAVTDYAVSSKMIRESHRKDLFFYENIVTDPASFVDNVLVKKLCLPERGRMLSRVKQPSGSKKMSLETTNSAIIEGHIDEVVNGWKRRVSPEMKDAGQRILDIFGIDQYSFVASDMPS